MFCPRSMRCCRRVSRCCPPCMQTGAMRAWWALSDLSRPTLVGAVIGFKLLEWWYSTGEKRVGQGDVLPVPPPPAPLPPAADGVPLPRDPRLCPLCRRARTNPAVLACSGEQRRTGFTSLVRERAACSQQPNVSGGVRTQCTSAPAPTQPQGTSSATPVFLTTCRGPRAVQSRGCPPGRTQFADCSRCSRSFAHNLSRLAACRLPSICFSRRRPPMASSQAQQPRGARVVEGRRWNEERSSSDDSPRLPSLNNIAIV